MRTRIAILPKQFVVVDHETTGFSPKTGDIVEIAALRINRDSDRQLSFRAFVFPRRKIPKVVAKLIGITQEQIEEKGRPLDLVLRRFIRFVGDRPLVVFNAEFCMPFLLNAASRNGLQVDNQVFCALKMARRAWPGRRTYRLEELAKAKGCFVDGAHRASRTCRLIASVYEAAASKLRRVK